MLPPNRDIFRSRWKALLWAALVCLGALQVAGGARHGDGGSDPDDDRALSDAANAMDGL